MIEEIDGIDLFVNVEKSEDVETGDVVVTVSMIIVIVMIVVVEEMNLYVDVEKDKNKAPFMKQIHLKIGNQMYYRSANCI